MTKHFAVHMEENNDSATPVDALTVEAKDAKEARRLAARHWGLRSHQYLFTNAKIRLRMVEVEPSMAPKRYGPCATVWYLCDVLFDRPRKEIIAACVEKGVNPSTAAVQYSKWKKAREA